MKLILPHPAGNAKAMTLGLRQGNHQPILEARSDDGDAEGKGTLSDDSVTGTVAFPDGKRISVKYVMSAATSRLGA